MEKSSLSNNTTNIETAANPSVDSKARSSLEPVAKGKIRERRATNGFIQNDAHSVGNYLVSDILLPTAKKALADLITNGISMLLYGEPGGIQTTNRFTGGSSYNRSSLSNNGYYNNASNITYGGNYGGRYNSARAATYSFELESKTDCYQVLDRIYEILDLPDGAVSIADVKDLIGIPDQIVHTDNNFGWSRLPLIEPRRGMGCWIIDFPSPAPFRTR